MAEKTHNPQSSKSGAQSQSTGISPFKTQSTISPTQDCIITEGNSAVISGRFSYGIFDVAMLTGEKIELQIRSEISESGWETIDTQDTDSNGRVSFNLPSGFLIH